MKKLSVILPVYNGEAFITKCIDSLLAQENIDLNTIEILVINDGSTDSSLDMLTNYAKQYSNIFTIIDQENKGAAATRNKAIAAATGEYVTLIDQDDWVDTDYVQTLLSAVEDGVTDVAQVGYKLVNTDKRVIKEVMPINTHFGQLLAIPAWAKIYETNFLKKNAIFFFENNIGEDSLFTLRVWLLSKAYKTVMYAGYNNYFDNQTNVTNSLHKGLSVKVNIIKLLDEMITIRSTEKNQQGLLDYNIIRTAMYYLLSYGKYAKPERFIEVYNELFQWLKSNIPNFKRNKYIWAKPAGEHAIASIGVKLIMSINSLNAVRLFAKVYCRNYR